MDGEEEPWNMVVGLTGLQNIDDMASIFLNEFFKPFYTYFVENLVEMNALLYLIIKAKASSEWYKKEELFDVYNSDTSKGEYNLDKKLREFLFESGIDYPYSTPRFT